MLAATWSPTPAYSPDTPPDDAVDTFFRGRVNADAAWKQAFCAGSYRSRKVYMYKDAIRRSSSKKLVHCRLLHVVSMKKKIVFQNIRIWNSRSSSDFSAERSNLLKSFQSFQKRWPYMKNMLVICRNRLVELVQVMVFYHRVLTICRPMTEYPPVETHPAACRQSAIHQLK